jgi:dihydropteroate synthase-like protein
LSQPSRILFITGKLAAPALRRQVAALESAHGFRGEVAVLPITVAALLTTKWVAGHLEPVPGIDRAILPGFCAGELQLVSDVLKVPVERGPRDLRDLPEYFGGRTGPPEGYGAFDIEILAEINHAPKLPLDATLKIAEHYRDSGADLIDLGCDPDGPWPGVSDCVNALRDRNFRVSIDSFNATEVEAALKAGAELVLSVNGTNAAKAVGWFERYGATVIAIPDTPRDLKSLDDTLEFLDRHGVPFRIDPILEPIGFGFAESLGRYLDARRRYPKAELMMGVGNLTELTDADSAGINVMLAGFCQELGIRSVLTTEVANACASAVKEFDLARRLVYHAVSNKVLPKKLEPRLVMLRDPKLREHGDLAELAKSITDPNYRLFAERGELHIINKDVHLRGRDPFALFEQLQLSDPTLDASHAFYLGFELAKALTALTLKKQYTQDRELQWGLLTVPEVSHRR